MASEKICAVLRGPRKIELSKKTVEDPGPDDVLICMKSIGICGTDISFWEDGHFLGRPLDGSIPGHECAGVVAKVGGNVIHLKEGDKVTVNPAISCGNCRECRSGNGTICDKMKGMGVVPHPYGGLMQSAIHPAQFVYKLPDSMTMDEAASIEPLCVAHRACEKAGISLGSNVLITGAGPIGMCCLLVAKAMGAATISITDLDEKRLSTAKAAGAKFTFTMSKGEDPTAAVGRIVKEAGGAPSCVLETSGSEAALNLGIMAVRKAGVVVQVGLPHGDIKVNMTVVILKEIQLKGTLGYLDRFEEMIEMVSNGSIDVKPLISHHFPMSRVQEAFEAASRRDGMKIIINVDDLSNL